MPRPFVLRVVLGVLVLIVALVALSRIDTTKSPTRVEKVIPDNALAR